MEVIFCGGGGVFSVFFSRGKFSRGLFCGGGGVVNADRQKRTKDKERPPISLDGSIKACLMPI